MREREPRGVQERARQVGDGAQVARHVAMDAAVQRIADDWVADGAQMDADLMRTAGVDRDVRQRERASKRFGPHDAGDRFTTAT